MSAWRVAVGWGVLTLVFVDEVLAATVAGFWGADRYDVVGAVAAPLLVVALWWTFASPRAPLGGRVGRPVVKVIVFGAATAALWWLGHEGLAVAFLAFSVTLNGLAQLPWIARLADPAAYA